MQHDIHVRTVETDILTRAVVGNLVIKGGQLRHLHKIAETLLLNDGIGHGELIVGGLLGIDSRPGIKAMDALLLHRLRTEVLEQQIQLRQGVADGRTAQERRTKVLARAVLDGSQGI